MAHHKKSSVFSSTSIGSRSSSARGALSRKAALELSIGTIVIVVLGMTMLILGLVLVRNIFTISTESVNTIDDKVQQEVAQLFSDEGEDVVVRLGPDHTAKVKSGAGDFRLAIGARTLDGSAASRERLQYKLTLDRTSNNNCASTSKLGIARTEGLFVTPLNTFVQFDKLQDSDAFALIQLNVPKATAVCSQKVFVDVKDMQTNQEVGGNFFIIEITK